MQTIIQIPLKQLQPGDKAKGGSVNARKTQVPIDGLVKSIEQHGLLLPLIVRKENEKLFSVVAGNRRLAALNKLYSATANFEVPCVEFIGANALEISLIENVDRENLHPVDQFEVFAAFADGGETIDMIAKRHHLPIKHVRQALALGRLAPEVRDAWRAGKIGPEAAEAFALTTDKKAQAAALRKVRVDAGAYEVKSALLKGGAHRGTSAGRIDSLLKFVTRAAYEKAGFEVNELLFDDDEEGKETVTDLPALIHMADEKIKEECAALVKNGWKWAMSIDDAPNDHYHWKRLQPGGGGHFSKEQMACAGCFVELQHDGKLGMSKGYVKPGDKAAAAPKKQQTERQKAAAAKEREERKEETGGLSNALAHRLSQQLTSAVREAIAAGGLGNDDVISFTIAALACAESPFKIRIEPVGRDLDERHDNDFVKYYKLASGKSAAERVSMLAGWLGEAVDLISHQAPNLMAMLHPGKDDEKDARVLVEAIKPAVMAKSAKTHFDLADYLASVSRDLITDAVADALGKEHVERVKKFKTSAEVREYASKHMAKSGWLPEALRLK